MGLRFLKNHDHLTKLSRILGGLAIGLLVHVKFAHADTEIRYNAGDMQYWVNNTWVSMNVADTGVGCSGAPGQIRINTGVSPSRLEFCDSLTWRRMDAEVTTSGCSTPGKIEFQTLGTLIRYCNGTNWVKTSTQFLEMTYYLTSGSTFIVPLDWANNENTIEVIGGGGGSSGAGGSGGGAYSKKYNVVLTPGSAVTYNVGSGGTNGANGGNTWFCNSTSNCANYTDSAVVVSAQGGLEATTQTGAAGGSATNGIGDVKYSGGNGGNHALGSGNSDGGGGGAGGPFGNGGNGGDGVGNDSGAGGGGGGGGTNGSGSNQTGGNNYQGVGAGAPSQAGKYGGGGGGADFCSGPGAVGGRGIEWDISNGSGGGGGGGGECTEGGSGGLYGGGGGGGTGTGAGGAQGIIVIKYKTGPDSTPTPFDFIDVYGAALSTVYEVSATLTGFDNSATTVNVSGGDAQVRRNNTGTWGSSVNVYPGDILNLRMTSSGSPSTGITATVTIGSLSVDWLVTTSTGVTRNYFVLTSAATASGNLGGLSGANAICVSDLLANDWLGKSLVEVNSSTVKAFLCDGSSCNNALANTTYSFAVSGSTTIGGGTFTTNGTAQGPGNATSWSGASYFGSTQNYWTGRASTSATLWAATNDTNHCTNWTSNAGGVNGRRGISNSTTATRWTHGTLIACNDATRKLICLVDHTTAVDSTPDYFDFVDVNGAALSTQYFTGQRLTGFVGPSTASVSGGGAEIRVNSTGSWVTSGLTINPGDVLNVRMTSSGTASTAIGATVAVGSSSVDWIINTSTAEYNYFVVTSGSFDGNLGGLSGANASCLSDLTAGTWLGKGNAVLNSSTVKAFLCDGTTCNNLSPNKTFAFARSGSATNGGDTFTTDGSGIGPGATAAWNIATKFGTTTYNIWTGRAAGANSAWSASSATDHCAGWATNTAGTLGQIGVSNGTNTARWASTTSACNLTRRLICSVEYTLAPDSVPDTFDFLDVTEATGSTLYETSTTVWGFVGPVTASVTGGGAEIRANGGGSWVTSGLTIYPGDILNLRMTSSATSQATVVATVTVGSGTADWSVTNADFYTTILVSTGTTWVVPADWNNSDNSIQVIGGGGGGGGGGSANGGGGGAYSGVTNVTLTPSSTVAVKVGAAGSGGVGANGSAGGDSYFCSSIANCATIGGTAVVVGAKGGSGSSSGSGGSSATGVGTVKYSGGSGNGGGCAEGGCGGGGSAGPSGIGKNGGGPWFGGGGGGGSNGGLSTNGQSATGEEGFPGGNGSLGTGGGDGGLSGAAGAGTAKDGSPGTFGGGGGGGGDYNDTIGGNGGAGGMQAIWKLSDGTFAGPGGGGGGAGSAYGSAAGGAGGAGGGYGGGGGAGGTGSSLRGNGGAGAPGIIVIRYIP